MNKLTKNERTVLADAFLKLAQLTGDFRMANYHDLSPLMQQRIRQYHRQLIDYADHYYTASTLVIMADAKPALDSLQTTISKLKTSIKRIQKIQLFIHSMGAATRLGASILSKQPLAIIAAMNDFQRSVSKVMDH